MSNSNDLQEKVKVELKNAKRVLLLEESRSAILAVCFACCLAHLIISPFSFWSMLSFFGVVHFGKKFKGTCKKQFILDKHMEFLKTPKPKSEKGWSIED